MSEHCQVITVHIVTDDVTDTMMEVGCSFHSLNTAVSKNSLLFPESVVGCCSDFDVALCWLSWRKGADGLEAE